MTATVSPAAADYSRPHGRGNGDSSADRSRARASSSAPEKSPTTRATSKSESVAVSDSGRPERFEIDEKGQIYRVVHRRNDAPPSRSFVGAVRNLKPRKKPYGQDELAALADQWFLKQCEASSPDLAAAGDGEIRVADLFGGCGAMTLGIAEACRALGMQFRMAGAFEIDDAALAVYSANFGGPEPRRDIERLLSARWNAPITKRERELVEEIGRVDFVVAGPPCQGHSNLNNVTRREDPKNELYFRLARFAYLFQPKWILIENVQAVLHDSGDVVARTRRALRKMGYHVDDGVARVDDLGVAQTRRRHLLFAVHKDAGLPAANVPKFAEVLERYKVPRRSVLWAIGDLAARNGKGLFDTASVPSAQTKQRIDWLFDNEKYDLHNSKRPKCQQGEHRYIGVYGRMRPEDPAPTITGGYDTMGRGRFVHPTRRRTVTPHEAARIQFFPDWFDFSVVTARARLAQIIGNAVPPKLSYVFALELMR